MSGLGNPQPEDQIIRIPSQGAQQLLPHEVHWRDKQAFLMEHGYLLRPRFRPGWVPSWLSDGRPPALHEDVWPINQRANFIDAMRISDGKLVFIKEVSTTINATELDITKYFSESPRRDDPRNHCVPLLDSFLDNDNPERSYMVMPHLLHVNSPPFRFVNDVVDFVDQLLEGLVFMHEQQVAHRDCAALNLMMDASSLFPQGYHPDTTEYLPDLSVKAPYIPRVASRPPVKYYYVDFGLASQFASGSTRELVTGIDGLDREVPELSNSAKYDPFKVDVIIVGNVLRNLILSEFANVDFIAPLFALMTLRNPADRPSAAQALDEWRKIRTRVWLVQRVCRLRRHSESPIKSVLLGVRDIFVFGSAFPRRYLGRTPRHRL